jgi:Mg2+ and Co2+ transporter CorA
MSAVRVPTEGVVACVAYTEGRRLGDVAISDFSEGLTLPGVFVWIGLHDPSPELLRQIQQELGLHDLAVEDAQAAHQRPKLEQYGDSIFVYQCSIRPDPPTASGDRARYRTRCLSRAGGADMLLERDQDGLWKVLCFGYCPL